jgi:glycosyltransferase 2 family protein
MNIRRIALGLLVSAVSLYFVLRGVQWGEVLNHLSQVNLPLFLFSMLLMLAAYFLMAWRWQLLLAPLEMPPVPNANDSPTAIAPATQTASVQREGLFSLYGKMLTGYFFNAFFPARAGDLVRAYLLGRKMGLRKTTVLATIVIEKAFDGIALLVIFLFSLTLLPVAVSRASGVSPDVLAWVAGLALVAAIVGLVLFYRFSDRIVHLVGRIFNVLPLPRKFERLIVRLVETFAGGMHIFRTPRPLLFAGTISLVIWGVVVAMFLVALVSFKAAFPAELMTLAGLLFMTGLVNLGLLVPALPGNLGTYEALCVAAMAVFGVSKDLAVAFALVFHVGQLVTTLVVGAVAFWAQKLSFAEMRPIEEKAEQEAAQSFDALDQETRP